MSVLHKYPAIHQCGILTFYDALFAIYRMELKGSRWFNIFIVHSYFRFMRLTFIQ